ncbi:MAG: DUF349 domain-containing protein [Crocinitomicaceae bacterium]
MKTEIIEKIENLANHEDLLSVGDEMKSLTDEFYKIVNEEERLFEVEKLERIEAGEKTEEILKPVDELLEKFNAAVQNYKEKRKAIIEAKKAEEATNLSTKKSLISELKELVANEEHIGKAIKAIQDIQSRWREVGPIPRDKRQDIQKDYSNLMDEFQYNINIYKEIKGHDLTKNAALKETVIGKLKALESEKSMKVLEQKLHQLQDEWNDIGGTTTEAWETLKENYWNTVNGLYGKIRDFYDGRRAEQKENILKKLALIDKIDEVLAIEQVDNKTWKTATDQILSIQAEWKTIGFGPKKENQIVWKGFRAKCDQFFNAKNEFFKDINADFDKVKAKKEALIEKLDGIKDSENWNDTTKLIVDLQRQWKQLGSAGQRNENKLWKKFREPIDAFFAKKDGHFEALDQANAGNLSLKEDLIKKIEAYKVPKDAKVGIAQLQEFSKSFSTIGNVPFKEKDRIYKAYKAALDNKYNDLDMEQSEKEAILYSAKIESIYNSPNMERELDKEAFFIRNKIDNLIKEKTQVETNLSFFANSDPNSPMLKSVKTQIEGIGKSVDSYKAKLKALYNFDQESE